MTTTPPSREHPMPSEQNLGPGLGAIMRFLSAEIGLLNMAKGPVDRAEVVEGLEVLRVMLTSFRDAIRARHAEHVRHLPTYWTDSIASDCTPTVATARARELAWVLGKQTQEKT